ncbi:MAG: MYXO-CTERM sorting domain-containing protein [Myxococcota bacterium]
MIGVVAGGFTLLSASGAVAAPRLLVTDPHAGRVLEFTDGGDISGEEFATGLNLPVGLCVGPDNDIYVAEAGSGEIKIITAGGDFAAAENFITAPGSFPVGLWCDADTVVLSTGLNAEFASGSILDITVGGDDVTQWPIFLLFSDTMNRPTPLDIVRNDTGAYFVSSTLGVYDASLGTGASTPPVVPVAADNENVVPIEIVDGAMLGGSGSVATVYDLTSATEFATAPQFATLPAAAAGGVVGLLDAGDLGVFAATHDGVYDITAGGDLTAASPMATGLTVPAAAPGLIGYVGMLRFDCTSNADCSDGNACTGEEVCEEGSCVEVDDLDCDDGDVCTANTCDPDAGCASEPVEGCCVADLDCPVDEICDAASNECVPVTNPNPPDPDTGGGADETGGGEPATDDGGAPGDGGEPATGTGGGAGTDGDPGLGGGEDPSGCACSATGPQRGMGAGLFGLLILGAAGRRRRR